MWSAEGVDLPPAKKLRLAGSASGARPGIPAAFRKSAGGTIRAAGPGCAGEVGGAPDRAGQEPPEPLVPDHEWQDDAGGKHYWRNLQKAKTGMQNKVAMLVALYKIGEFDALRFQLRRLQHFPAIMKQVQQLEAAHAKHGLQAFYNLGYLEKESLD